MGEPTRSAERAVIQAVVFDVDGVLVHPWAFENRLAVEFGITREMTTTFVLGAYQECLTGGAKIESVLQPYLDDWGWPGSAERFVDVWLEESDAPNADTLDTVRHLRACGVPCYVGSNQADSRARYMEDRMGFTGRFDGLFFSCDLGLKKPDPAFFREISTRLELLPTALLLVDDDPANVGSARSEGWQAEVFTSTSRLRAELSRLGLPVPDP